MAVGLPVFISDIPVFREITNGNAIFFPLNDPVLAAQLIWSEINDKRKLKINGIEGLRFVQNEYSQQKYRDRLLKIYSEVTGIAL
jgi:glycosyltransferase involved in cell wall biosynthesis